jgi:hypothetical protein
VGGEAPLSLRIPKSPNDLLPGSEYSRHHKADYIPSKMSLLVSIDRLAGLIPQGTIIGVGGRKGVALDLRRCHPNDDSLYSAFAAAPSSIGVKL